MFQIEEELKKLPGKPGVYIMHGEKDEIIYVGKAVSLKTGCVNISRAAEIRAQRLNRWLPISPDLSILSQIRNWKPLCWSVI